MTGILTVMLFTAVVVPNHAIYPGFLPYAPPAVPFPYIPFQRSLPAQPLFAYTIHTAVPPSVPSSVQPSVPQRAAASEVRSFYSPTDNTYQGYSYQTQYEDGGKSEVVFAVGPEAEQIMKKSLEFFDSIIPRDFGRQFNTNETDATNGSSSAVPRIYPNNAFNLFSPTPFFPDTITSFVNTIVKENTSATEVNQEAQESMIHGDIAASPSPNEGTNSISTSDESIDSRSSASESSTTIDSISSTVSDSNSISDSISSTASDSNSISDSISSGLSDSNSISDSISSTVSDSNSISTSTATTAAENNDISVTTTTASMTTTTISATMPPPTTTASSTTAAQVTTTLASSPMTEDESNDITRTTEVSISAESSPDSTTIATTAATASETTTEGITETTSA